MELSWCLGGQYKQKKTLKLGILAVKIKKRKEIKKMQVFYKVTMFKEKNKINIIIILNRLQIIFMDEN